MRYTRVLPVGLLAAVAVEATFLPFGCSYQPTKSASCIQVVHVIKSTTADYQQACRKGRMPAAAPGASTQDSPGPALSLMLNNLRHCITRQITDETKQAIALEMIDKADALIHDQIAPSYTKAWNSRQADDARALVPLLDELGRQMDDLLRVLS